MAKPALPMDGEDPRAAVETDDTEDESVTDSDKQSATSSKTYDWIRFAFGRGTDWCLWGDTSLQGWNRTNDTQAINAFKDLKLGELYNIALTREGGWIATGLTKERAPCVAYYKITSGTIAVCEAKDWVKAHDGYQRLFQLLNLTYGTQDAAIANAKFSTGPHGAWWAKLSDGTHHHNLPGRLQDELKEAAKKNVSPEHVALGHVGSYVALWTDARITWYLIGYDKLHERLKDGDSDVDFVALSPMYNTEYLYVQSDRMVCYSASLGNDGNRDLRRETSNYMQRRAKTDGTTMHILTTAYGWLPCLPSPVRGGSS
jgi:hypothetical protein